MRRGGDEKVIAVPVPKLTKRYAHIANYTDLPEIMLQQIQHFFQHYKDLEPGKWSKVVDWGMRQKLRELIVGSNRTCTSIKLSSTTQR